VNAPDAIDTIRPAVAQIRIFGDGAYDPVEKKDVPNFTGAIGTGFIVNEDACGWHFGPNFSRGSVCALCWRRA
jgi:hypothetical protein